MNLARSSLVAAAAALWLLAPARAEDLVDPSTLASQSISAKGAALTSLYNSATFPHDWTEGTGTLGSSGEIDIAAPATGAKRLWLLIQNQGTQPLPVRYEARLANGTTQSFVTLMLAPAPYTGQQGGSDERGFSAFVPQGQVKIGNTGNAALANLPVAVLEIVE
jgi:hypothetical protein